MQQNNHTSLGSQVPLGKIETSLRELWEQDSASSKASLINFAVYSERPGVLEENQAIIKRITEEQACRVLLIELDRDAPETSSEAWISAHCNLIGGQKSVCSEQIAFKLSGRETGRLRNLVFSHLESDLPLVFWWQGELSDRFSERLYSLVDRLIIDSSDWSEAIKGLQRIQQAEVWVNGGLVVQDLEWTRSYHHRLALASLFDEPAALAVLEGLNQVRIVVNPRHRVCGLMVVAWLMGRAGWSLSPGLELLEVTRAQGSWTMSLKNGREFEMVLELDESCEALGTIELSSAQARAAVTKLADEGHLQLSVDAAAGAIELLHPSGPIDTAGLLAQQLSRGGRNALFRSMLPRLIELLRAERDGGTGISQR